MTMLATSGRFARASTRFSPPVTLSALAIQYDSYPTFSLSRKDCSGFWLFFASLRSEANADFALAAWDFLPLAADRSAWLLRTTKKVDSLPFATVSRTAESTLAVTGLGSAADCANAGAGPDSAAAAVIAAAAHTAVLRRGDRGRCIGVLLHGWYGGARRAPVVRGSTGGGGLIRDARRRPLLTNY
ncbi:hypothetical protein ACFRCW_07425 [Streptomyces sp. NPDC056653]|uniref:hypothetical protein n=1 Tax=Streptomyces sp. NPDC056653 TaxID=3345894 RepID=UPI00368C2094